MREFWKVVARLSLVISEKRMKKFLDDALQARMRTMTIAPSHFIAEATGPAGSYSDTLTSLFGEILWEVESRFGERDKSWTILGIEFGPKNPQTRFPAAEKHVIIQLSRKAVQETWQACYQLAHETVHLLSPNGGESKGKVIEEGVAESFAIEYVGRVFRKKIQEGEFASYGHAVVVVRQLLAISADAIRALRQIEPSFDKMTPDTFVKAGLVVPRELINELLAPFVRERNLQE